jgi:hypothetical protein
MSTGNGVFGLNLNLDLTINHSFVNRNHNWFNVELEPFFTGLIAGIDYTISPQDLRFTIEEGQSALTKPANGTIFYSNASGYNNVGFYLVHDEWKTIWASWNDGTTQFMAKNYININQRIAGTPASAMLQSDSCYVMGRDAGVSGGSRNIRIKGKVGDVINLYDRDQQTDTTPQANGNFTFGGNTYPIYTVIPFSKLPIIGNAVITAGSGQVVGDPAEITMFVPFASIPTHKWVIASATSPSRYSSSMMAPVQLGASGYIRQIKTYFTPTSTTQINAQGETEVFHTIVCKEIIPDSVATTSASETIPSQSVFKVTRYNDGNHYTIANGIYLPAGKSTNVWIYDELLGTNLDTQAKMSSNVVTVAAIASTSPTLSAFTSGADALARGRNTSLAKDKITGYTTTVLNTGIWTSLVIGDCTSFTDGWYLDETGNYAFRVSNKIVVEKVLP